MIKINNVLTPESNMHLKNVNTGDIYEGAIYLGIYDSASNYVEVTEEEYQEYLNRDLEEEVSEYEE